MLYNLLQVLSTLIRQWLPEANHSLDQAIAVKDEHVETKQADTLWSITANLALGLPVDEGLVAVGGYTKRAHAPSPLIVLQQQTGVVSTWLSTRQKIAGQCVSEIIDL